MTTVVTIVLKGVDVYGNGYVDLSTISSQPEIVKDVKVPKYVTVWLEKVGAAGGDAK
jgi:hypothetical protein